MSIRPAAIPPQGTVEFAAYMGGRLTAGVTFEPGVNPEQLVYVEALGFLATTRDTPGTVEVVGYRASKGGLYDAYGGASPAWYARSRTEPQLVPPESLQFASGSTHQLTLANRPEAVFDHKADRNREGVQIELWGVGVRNPIRDWRTNGGGSSDWVRVANALTARPRFSVRGIFAGVRAYASGVNGGEATVMRALQAGNYTDGDVRASGLVLYVDLPKLQVNGEELPAHLRQPLRMRKLGVYPLPTRPN
ncbi:MAG TPA: hypothetical protein VLF71_05960 [Candidatus Saccharimonadales bacterium]|nr:hypothetical protein [Candidatus Saccharimonadales bacterium]